MAPKVADFVSKGMNESHLLKKTGLKSAKAPQSPGIDGKAFKMPTTDPRYRDSHDEAAHRSEHIDDFGTDLPDSDLASIDAVQCTQTQPIILTSSPPREFSDDESESAYDHALQGGTETKHTRQTHSSTKVNAAHMQSLPRQWIKQMTSNGHNASSYPSTSRSASPALSHADVARPHSRQGTIHVSSVQNRHDSVGIDVTDNAIVPPSPHANWSSKSTGVPSDIHDPELPPLDDDAAMQRSHVAVQRGNYITGYANGGRPENAAAPTLATHQSRRLDHTRNAQATTQKAFQTTQQFRLNGTKHTDAHAWTGDMPMDDLSGRNHRHRTSTTDSKPEPPKFSTDKHAAFAQAPSQNGQARTTSGLEERSDVRSYPWQTSSPEGLSGELDYAPDDLVKKDFAMLQSEVVDRPVHAPGSGMPFTGSIEDLHKALSAVCEQTPREQAALLQALGIDQWEEAGRWIMSRQSELVGKLTKLRREKRAKAMELEKEIAARHQAVVQHKRLLEENLRGLKEAGVAVLAVGTPSKKRKTSPTVGGVQAKRDGGLS
ncbi:hypothetical protein CAC42_1659 [Sphaceloma murrayae]|uniref:Extracellular mutant protein 11 C-terminal domain-containing protein n=1 Tax=Sphaceloma murrayae TaxID=2082308 RepID=A0A2K1QHL3_9PEZI|nr:hypothetical protein CAC42_1659 [Sphaceloma murrayae]